jgi:hypothetical protein
MTNGCSPDPNQFIIPFDALQFFQADLVATESVIIERQVLEELNVSR